jgi:hypothetical protein
MLEKRIMGILHRPEVGVEEALIAFRNLLSHLCEILPPDPTEEDLERARTFLAGELPEAFLRSHGGASPGPELMRPLGRILQAWAEVEEKTFLNMLGSTEKDDVWINRYKEMLLILHSLLALLARHATREGTIPFEGDLAPVKKLPFDIAQGEIRELCLDYFRHHVFGKIVALEGNLLFGYGKLALLYITAKWGARIAAMGRGADRVGPEDVARSWGLVFRRMEAQATRTLLTDLQDEVESCLRHIAFADGFPP